MALPHKVGTHREMPSLCRCERYPQIYEKKNTCFCMSQHQCIVFYFFRRENVSINWQSDKRESQQLGAVPLTYFRDVGKSLIRLWFCLRIIYFWGRWASGSELPLQSQLAPCSIGMSCPISKDGVILLYLPHRGVVRNSFMFVQCLKDGKCLVLSLILESLQYMYYYLLFVLQ